MESLHFLPDLILTGLLLAIANINKLIRPYYTKNKEVIEAAVPVAETTLKLLEAMDIRLIEMLPKTKNPLLDFAFAAAAGLVESGEIKPSVVRDALPEVMEQFSLSVLSDKAKPNG